jgi:VanZ family protein
MKLRLSIFIIWMIIFLTLLLAPVSQTRIADIWAFAQNDKIIHFILFFITTIVIVFCTKLLWSFKVRVIIGIVFGVFIAASTELVQSLIPTRYMSISDFISNIGGLVTGLLLYLLFYSIKKIRPFI